MNSGLPLIVSDIPILREMTGNGKAALCVPVKNPEAIVSAVVELMTNQILANNLRFEAKKIVIEKYSLNSMVSKYECLYSQPYFQIKIHL